MQNSLPSNLSLCVKVASSFVVATPSAAATNESVSLFLTRQDSDGVEDELRPTNWMFPKCRIAANSWQICAVALALIPQVFNASLKSLNAISSLLPVGR